MKTPVIISWSGGKDSSMALYAVQEAGEHEVVAMVTTINEGYDRASMHGVRRSLIEKQAQAIGIPLHKVSVSTVSSNEEYCRRTSEVFLTYRDRGVTQVVFGDLFLADVKHWRDEFLSGLGMGGLYPIWKQDTSTVARRFIDHGFRAVLVCVDGEKLGPDFAGREFDDALLRDLPSGVDPCGENGEFHTFVYDGPIFEHHLIVKPGERVTRSRFHYFDLL